MPKQPAQQPKHSALANLIAWTAILVVGVAAYSNSFRVPFVLDDLTNIQNNPYMHVTQFDRQSLAEAAWNGPSSRRPVANVTLALNYYAGRERVVGYHVVNLAIHLACGGLVYLLGRVLYERAGSSPSPAQWVALVAALIFLGHPIQIQAVTYIVQRMASLAAMFYLMALVCYVYGRMAASSGRQWSWWAAAIASGLLALGCKENAATLPIAVLMVEWYFFQDQHSDWLRRRLTFLLPVLALLLIAVAVNPTIRAEILAGYETRDFTMWERVLTQFRVIVFYLSLVIWPLPERFCLTHDLAVSHGWFDPVTTLLSLVLLVTLFVFAVYSARRWPVVSFGILWVFLHLAIESSIIPLEMVHEHRMYLPMAGVAWLTAWVLFAVLQNVRWAGVASGCLVVLLALATHTRNEVWRNPQTLWRDVLAKYPENARAHNNLGYMLVSQGKVSEGLRQHRQALKYDPHYADAHYNVGTILDAQGNVDEAIDHYRRALELNPRLFQAHNNLGNKLAQQGELDEAIEHFRLAIALSTRFAMAHNNLGNALGLQGQFEEAIEQYRIAIEIEPKYAQARFSLANYLASQGERDEALQQYHQALELAVTQDNRPLADAIRARLNAYQ